ncbi:MAG: hypothetical protein MZU84_04965 [Sphingobacterium sp.]|nr:hypothetical protein [Sphingobacterium sp.]
MRDRWGEAALAERFRAFDTICSATQDRQDAVLKMLRGGRPRRDGGDRRLQQQQHPGARPHLRAAAADLPHQRRRPHRGRDASATGRSGRTTRSPTEGWLPAGPVTVGLTAGASANNKIGETPPCACARVSTSAPRSRRRRGLTCRTGRSRWRGSPPSRCALGDSSWSRFPRSAARCPTCAVSTGANGSGAATASRCAVRPTLPTPTMATTAGTSASRTWRPARGAVDSVCSRLFNLSNT